MKRYLSFLIMIAMPASTLLAQDEGEAVEAGFLQFVNLVSLNSPTYIELANFELNGGEPVTPGDSSGILAIKPNNYTFTVTNEGTNPKTISGPLDVVNGQNVVVICYDETKELEDGETESRLKFNLLTESLESDLPRLSLVSLLKVPSIQISVDGQPVMLHERRAYRKEVKIDDVVNINRNGSSLGEIEIAKRSHYIGFVYLDPETGKEGISLIQNEKLEYHPPLEDEEEEEEADEPAEEPSDEEVPAEADGGTTESD